MKAFIQPHTLLTILLYSMFYILVYVCLFNLPKNAAAYSIGFTLTELVLITFALPERVIPGIKQRSPFLLNILVLGMAVFITMNVKWFIDYIFVLNDGYDTISLQTFLFTGTNYLLIYILVHSLAEYYAEDDLMQGSNNNHYLQSLQLKKDAELFKLRQQVDPHFLFNSLNSIQALTILDSAKANEMIYSLSQYFRNAIQKQDKNYILLSEEIEDIRLYLQIEKIRFGHRLNVTEDIDNHLLKTSIPPLIFQPLVENAIKYGVYGTSDHVNIHISIKVNQDYPQMKGFITCTISNPFDPYTKITSGTGFGIEGVKRRLYLMYSRSDLLKIEKHVSGDAGKAHTFTATLFIPDIPTSSTTTT